MFAKITRKIAVIFCSFVVATNLSSSSVVAQSTIIYTSPQPEKEASNSPIDSDSSCQYNLEGAATTLTPNHTGLTTSARPTLFYYLSRKVSNPAKLVLAKIDGREAIIDRDISLDSASGLKSFSLPPEVKLEIGKKYLWSLVLVCNSVHPSEDIISQGTIERVELPSKLQRRLKLATSERERAQLYAQFGFWYDALASIAQSNNSKATEDLQALLRQGGISANRLGF